MYIDRAPSGALFVCGKDRMVITQDTIITLASVLGAFIAIFTAIFAVYRWYLKQNQQDKEIKALKEEQCLIVYGLLACLKGLKEQGCNGPVTEAVDKLEKHINKKAHDMEG